VFFIIFLVVCFRPFQAATDTIKTSNIKPQNNRIDAVQEIYKSILKMRRQFRNCRVAILLLLLLLKVALVSCFQTIPVVVVPQTAPSFLDIRHMRCGRNASSSSSTQCRMSEDSSGIPSGTDLEKTWRYVKKPLLSIGAKGATASHGNSLKELLQDHTAVKVKVNTKAFGVFFYFLHNFMCLFACACDPILPSGLGNTDTVLLIARLYTRTTTITYRNFGKGIRGT